MANESSVPGGGASEAARPPARPGPFLLREPVVIAWLSLMAVALFALTHYLVRASQAHQQTVAESWAKQGLGALSANQAAAAAADFRNALLYAPDDPRYRLKLAQALLIEGQREEAELFLRGLWEDEPANGRVNLELARLAVYHQDVAGALRFYHGAIYGLWENEGEARRREVRLELIGFLMRKNFPTLARSELIALEPDVAADAPAQVKVAALFAQAGDEESALRVYQKALGSQGRDPHALAGAGDAAYQLGRYALALQYLQRAVAEAPADTDSAGRAEICRLILRLDPNQPALSEQERAARAAEAFRQAGTLLQRCAAPAAETAPAWAEAGAAWKALQPGLSTQRLRRDPAYFGQVMQAVAGVARSLPGDCAPDDPLPEALRVVSRGEEGSR